MRLRSCCQFLTGSISSCKTFQKSYHIFIILDKMWLYRLLLTFLHIILYLRLILLEIFLGTKRFFAGIFESRGKSFNEIHSWSSTLNTLPQHISFLILESEILFEDVAKLIVWSMAVGISYISIYDRRGELKPNLLSPQKKVVELHF